jgi:hypothetical protein
VRAALAFAVALAACSSRSSSPAAASGSDAAAASAGPRLVVLVVIDQLPEWSFDKKATAATDGIARLLTGGRRYVSRYPYAATQTAPGHAALSTGAPPAVSGILANEWFHPDIGRVLRATEDPAGGPPSARWLEVDGNADTLARVHPGAKAVAVSLKDRSALLVLGHSGLAIWYDEACTCMRTTGDPPKWLADLASAHPIAPRLGDPWVASDPAKLAALSGSPDDAPGELSLEGWTASFPHDPKTATMKPPHAVLDTPLGNQIVLEAAIAAIGGEGLGKDDVPDYLAVSFSAYDYIGHAFGQDSWESWDGFLALDHQIGDLERALDAQVGAGRWAMVLTSDHGAVELPERREARGLPGARLSYDEVAAIAEKGADAAVRGGPWIASAFPPNVWLTATARALPDAQRGKVIDGAIAALRANPAIDRAERTADLAGHCDTGTDDDRALCLSLEPARAGEIIYDPAEGTVLYKPGWKDAVSHGSLHAYDREVPLVVLAPGVAPGVVSGTVSGLSVAPTIAALLGIPPPPAATAPSLYGQAPDTSR